LLAGEEALIRLKDRREIWFNVYIERLQITCWVSSGANGTVDAYGDLSQIPIFVPATSTPTFPLPRLVVLPSTTPTTTSSATDTPTSTYTPTPENATVIGTIWEDANNNSAHDGGEIRFQNVLVWIERGSCGGTYLKKFVTDTKGQFSFSGLQAGTYCINVDVGTIDPPPTYGWMCTTQNTNKVLLTLKNGELQNLPFGFYDTLH
jgi:hypothetical protein